MKKTLALFLLVCTLPVTVHATTPDKREWDIYLGGYIWQTAGKGSLNAPDFGDYSLALSKSGTNTNAALYVTLEHPNIYLPNIKLSQSSIKQTGNTTFSMNTDSYSVAADGNGTVDLSHTDITFFYRPWQNNWFQLDAGLTARLLYSELSSAMTAVFTVGSLSSPPVPMNLKTDMSTTLALIYARTFFVLPVKGMGVGMELNAGETSTEDSSDLTIHLDYEMPAGLGFSGGYRLFTSNLNGKGIGKSGGNTIKVDIDGDLDVQGMFVSMYYHF